MATIVAAGLVTSMSPSSSAARSCSRNTTRCSDVRSYRSCNPRMSRTAALPGAAVGQAGLYPENRCKATAVGRRLMKGVRAISAENPAARAPRAGGRDR